MSKKYNTIGVQYKNSRNIYTYVVPDSIEVDVGEQVVVDTSTGLTIVNIVEVHEEPQDTNEFIEYKYISYTLCKVVV